MGHYIGIIERDGSSAFIIAFPDFPGCAASATSLDDAFRVGREALDRRVGEMADAGEPIPPASALDVVLRAPGFRGGVPVMVPAATAGVRTVRVNVTVPEDALRDIDAHAEAHGQTRSGFLVTAAKAAIRAEEQAAHQETAAEKQDREERAVIDLWGSGDRRTSSFLARMASQSGKSHGILGATPDGRPAPLSGPAQEEFRRFFEQTMKAAAHLHKRVAEINAQPPIAIPSTSADQLAKH